jgi:hypothetical protein
MRLPQSISAAFDPEEFWEAELPLASRAVRDSEM